MSSGGAVERADRARVKGTARKEKKNDIHLATEAVLSEEQGAEGVVELDVGDEVHVGQGHELAEAARVAAPPRQRVDVAMHLLVLC